MNMKKSICLATLILFMTGAVFGQSADDFNIEQNAQGTITITGLQAQQKT